MTTLYEKVGRRYKPARDDAAFDGLPNGTWLVTIADGRRSAQRMIDPRAGFETLGTIPEVTEWVVELLREWTRSRPARPLTAKEKRAWKAYTDIMGDDATLMIQREAAQTIANEVATRIARRANGETVAARDDDKF